MGQLVIQRGAGGGGLQNVVEDLTPQLGGQLDVNGFAIGDGTLELLKFSETVSAVNEVTVANAATGSGPTISATGDDLNVPLNLAGKGTMPVALGGVTPVAGTKLMLPLENDAVTPTLAFGDGDTGLYENADDALAIANAGVITAQWTSAGLSVSNVRAALLRNAAVSATVPAYSFNADNTTGVGSDGTGRVNIINSGTEGARFTSSECVFLRASSFSSYLDILEIATPALPAANTIRINAFDQNGRSVLEYQTNSGITVRLGRDSMLVVRNTSGGTIPAGRVVYVTGSTGQIPNISEYIADGSIVEGRPLGLTVESSDHNAFTFVLQLGRISGLNTLSFLEGDRVYVSAVTAGLLTNTAPAHPNLRVVIGIVARSHGTQGAIIVQPISVRGDHLGTNSNTWSVGSNTAGAKDLVYRNGFDLNLQANPTAARTLTLPDATDTLVARDTTDTLTNKTLTTPTIGSFANAAHNHTNAAGGGQITDAALSAAVGIAKGGSGQTTQQAAIDALTNVAAATNEHVLTKDTATGNAIFKASVGGGGGDNISVNSVAATDADFDDATPAAPAGGVNVKWQKDLLTPNNVSAHLAANDVSNTVLADMPANSVKVRAAGTTGDPSDLAVGTNTVLGRAAGNIVAAQIVAAQLGDNSVENTKLDDMSGNTVKARASSTTGDPQNVSIPTNNVLCRLSGDITASPVTTALLSANAVDNTIIRDSGALSVIGRNANSSGDPADISATATSGAVLRESGSTLAFGTVATAGLADDSVTDGKLRDSAATSVIGRSAGTSGDPADIAAASDGHYLRRATGTVAFGAIADGDLPTTLAGKTLTTPTIASFVNATHDHTNAAGGGQITDAALSAAVGIAKGGSGQTTQQTAINALTNVSAATNEHVLTKDTATGNAVFKVAPGAGGGTALKTVAIAFTDGDTLRRVTIVDGDVSASSRVQVSIRRPDTTDDVNDEGYLYLPNVVRVASGVFDVLVACLDWGFGDPVLNPPNETIQLTYHLG